MNSVELIIQEVEKRPYLWNTKLRDKSFDADVEWETIGTMVGLPGHLVKAKWRNLRDAYRKTLRRKLEAGEAVEKWEVNWSHFHRMKFLLETLILEITSGQNARKSLDVSLNFDPKTLEEILKKLQSNNTKHPNAIVSEQNPRIASSSDSDEGVDKCSSNGEWNRLTKNTSNRTLSENFEPGYDDSIEPGEIVDSPTRLLKRNRSKLSFADSAPYSESYEPDGFHSNPESRSPDFVANTEKNDDYLFFKSLLPYVKELDLDARMKIRESFQLVLSQQLLLKKSDRPF